MRGPILYRIEIVGRFEAVSNKSGPEPIEVCGFEGSGPGCSSTELRSVSMTEKIENAKVEAEAVGTEWYASLTATPEGCRQATINCGKSGKTVALVYAAGNDAKTLAIGELLAAAPSVYRAIFQNGGRPDPDYDLPNAPTDPIHWRRDDLVKLARMVQKDMFMIVNPDLGAFWDRDKSVSGSDLVDGVCSVLSECDDGKGYYPEFGSDDTVEE